MGRHEFLGVLAATVAWPPAARAGQPERMRRVAQSSRLTHLASRAPKQYSFFRRQRLPKIEFGKLK